MSKRSRDKGNRRERELVHKHAEMGVAAKRVPLSGAAAGFKGDLKIDLTGELTGEVKARANGEGFVTLKRWLGDNDLLFLVEDRSEPLVAMSWSTYERLARIIKAAELLERTP